MIDSSPRFTALTIGDASSNPTNWIRWRTPAASPHAMRLPPGCIAMHCSTPCNARAVNSCPVTALQTLMLLSQLAERIYRPSGEQAASSSVPSPRMISPDGPRRGRVWAGAIVETSCTAKRIAPKKRTNPRRYLPGKLAYVQRSDNLSLRVNGKASISVYLLFDSLPPSTCHRLGKL